MNESLKPQKSTIIFYPIIFAIFPLLSLYIENFGLISFSEVLVGIFFVLILLAIFWWTIYRINKNNRKSALIASLFFILFFSFGHFLQAAANILLRFGVDIRSQIFNNVSLKLIVMLIAIAILFIVFTYLINKVQSDFRIITTFMNVTSIGILTLALFQSTMILVNQNKLIKQINQININNNSQLDEIGYDLPLGNSLPNIYYIILDGYGRTDILTKYYDFNNQDLDEYLIEKGFFISSASESNYPHTVLSLASSLNMRYLDDLASQMGKNSDNPVPIIQLIQTNRTIEFLIERDYEIVSFETGYGATELRKMNSYLSPPKNLTQFQNELINLTPLKILTLGYQYDIQRQRIQFIFDQLPPEVQIDKPMFVFAHITSPHPPFVFGPNGEKDNLDMGYSTLDANYFTDVAGKSEYIRRYKNQVTYINKLLRKSIDKILAQSPENTIIIIQGDHGPGSMLDWGSIENTNIEERMSILNAYYFPDQDYSNLYPNITPVNSFRIILDQYLGTNLGLLEDRSYFSLMETPYDFVDVTSEVNNE